MATVLLSILVLGLVMAGMAVGVIFTGKPIKGSCGGMAAMGFKEKCDICGGDTQKCDEEQQRQQQNASAKSQAENSRAADSQAYNAMPKGDSHS